MARQRNQRDGPLWWTLLIVPTLFLAITVVLALWHSPPHVLEAIQRQDLDSLRWLRVHWLNAVSLTALGTAVAALIPLLLRWLERKQPKKITEQSTKELAIIRRRVRYRITGALEYSLSSASELVPDLKRRLDVTELGMRTVGRSENAAARLPYGTSVYDVFDELGGGLLILGAPGSGKTIALLQLAEKLLQSENYEQSIPVLVNLASWTIRRPPISLWLADELWESYKVPPPIAERLLQQDALILLLDGLDEAAKQYRAACVDAINTYRRDHGLARFVVCCRSEELEELAARLDLDEAIELQPLRDDQVGVYLDRLDETGTDLTEVRVALANDEDLRDLSRSPLMLHLITQSYRGRQLPASLRSGSVEEREQQLWQAYVDRMFEQRPLRPGFHFTPAQAKAWLGWIAGVVQDWNQTVFRLDRLTPDFLLPRNKRTIFLSDSAGAKWQLRWADSSRPVSISREHLSDEAHKRITAALFDYVSNITPSDHTQEVSAEQEAPDSKATADPSSTVPSRLYHKILNWLKKEASKNWEPVGRLGWSWKALRSRFKFDIETGSWERFMWLWLIPFAGLTRRAPSKRYLRSSEEGANRSIWRSGQNGLLVGISAFIYVELILGVLLLLPLLLLLPPEHPPMHLATIGVLIGCAPFAIALGLFAGLKLGGAAYVIHYVIRVILARSGECPWKYEQFLNAMADRGLLRRTDGGYSFVHILLRDYLADQG